MPERLMINPDNYGRTPEILLGIRESHLHGVVRSTTCMMTIPTTPADKAIVWREEVRVMVYSSFSINLPGGNHVSH